MGQTQMPLKRADLLPCFLPQQQIAVNWRRSSWLMEQTRSLKMIKGSRRRNMPGNGDMLKWRTGWCLWKLSAEGASQVVRWCVVRQDCIATEFGIKTNVKDMRTCDSVRRLSYILQ